MNTGPRKESPPSVVTSPAVADLVFHFLVPCLNQITVLASCQVYRPKTPRQCFHTESRVMLARVAQRRCHLHLCHALCPCSVCQGVDSRLSWRADCVNNSDADRTQTGQPPTNHQPTTNQPLGQDKTGVQRMQREKETALPTAGIEGCTNRPTDDQTNELTDQQTDQSIKLPRLSKTQIARTNERTTQRATQPNQPTKRFPATTMSNCHTD